MTLRVIGLMSGTSVDGIDAALVEISGGDGSAPLQVKLLQSCTYDYLPALRSQILEVCSGQPLSMEALATLDRTIGLAFAQAAIAVNQGFPKADLIGSHGQTVFHRPPSAESPIGYSYQLGWGPVIAEATQIQTVSNFRAADLAVGGQGAPLVPPVDAALLTHPTRHRAVQNIGGIGNVTFLPAAGSDDRILGWDTGPGNMLLDLAVTQLTQGEKTYDADGAWASRGTIDNTLVDRWLDHPFFHLPPPKSTGRELFGADYLAQCWQDAHTQGDERSPADFLACLTDLTARSIALNYERFLPRLPDEVLLCGGGSRNGFLVDRLQQHLPDSQVLTTDAMGLNSDVKEAIAFAVLAYWNYHRLPGNLPAVTGATTSVILGENYSPPLQKTC